MSGMMAKVSSNVQQTVVAAAAFVKVYNGILALADIQSLHATYKARFGY